MHCRSLQRNCSLLGSLNYPGHWVHHALLDTSTQLQLGGQMGFGDWVHALPDSLIQLVTPRRAMFMLTQNIVDF